MPFLDLALRELFPREAPRPLLGDPPSRNVARSAGAAASRKRGAWFPWKIADAPRANDPVFSGPSRRLANALFAGDISRAAAERASGAPVAGVFHAGEPLLSVAARHSLPMLQAIWHPRGAWDANAMGATPWMAALAQAAPETVAWLGFQMQKDGCWERPEAPARAKGNLPPLFFLAHCSAQRAPTEAFSWIKDDEFWLLDSMGAGAFEHALDAFSLNRRPELADALLAEAFSRPKTTPKAQAGWRRWVRIAVDEHLDAGLEWPVFSSAMERAALRAAIAPTGAPDPEPFSSPRARAARI